MYTIKYQLVVGAITGGILFVYGPELGSVHDATILKNSGFDVWLRKHGEYCLGDRGYQGCSNIVAPHKSYGDDFTRTEEQHNKNVGKYRNLIERIFANLKKWHILKNIFRGYVGDHFNIFFSCCLLEAIR